MLVLHDLALDVVIRIAGVGGGRTDAGHTAVVAEHQPLQLDENDLSRGVEKVVARIELKLDRRFRLRIVEVDRFIDIAVTVGGDDLAGGENRLIHRPRSDRPVVHAGILGFELRLQVLDRYIFQPLFLEIGAGIYLGRLRVPVIVVTANEEQPCRGDQKQFRYFVHNIRVLFVSRQKRK